jgi:hypothetical protein
MSSDAILPTPSRELYAVTPQNAVDSAPVSPAPRYDAEPFRPDGGVPAVGLLLTLGGAIASGYIIGSVVGFVAQWLYLVLLFPAGVGLGIGALIGYAVKQGKVRNPLFAGFAGLLSGAVAVLSMHYFEYQSALGELDAQSPAFQQAVQNGGFTFLQYFEARAKEGVALAPTGPGEAINLGYYGSYIYWLVDAIFAIGTAWVLPYLAAKKPFCTHCSNWKEEQRLAQVDPAWQRTIVDALKQGELLRLLEGSGHTGVEGLVLKLASCNHCGETAPVEVIAERLEKDAKGVLRTTELACVTYPGEVLRHLGRTLGV